MKKEEEQQLKEVERMIREEEARLAQEEKQKQKDKLKNKFASFFVAKKRDPEEAEEKSSNGNFKEFRVSVFAIRTALLNNKSRALVI